MTLRDGLLFVHLVVMAGYLMLFGIEWLAVAGLVQSQENHWLSVLQRISRASQWMLVGIFLSGGVLVEGVKPADRAGFAVTLVMFLALGALTGVSARRYRPGGETSRFLQRSVLIRAALIAATMLLVSSKPNMSTSLAVFAVAALVGVFAGWPSSRGVKVQEGRL